MNGKFFFIVASYYSMETKNLILLSFSAVMFCNNFLAYTVHIDIGLL